MSADTLAPEPRFPAALRLFVLGLLEVSLVTALHQLGRYEWMRIGWADVGRWVSDSPAEDVLVSILRTGTLVLAWWLLISTVLYTASAAAGSRGLVRSIGWAMFPAARRVVDGVLALSITGGPVLARPVAAMPVAAETSASPGGGIAELPAAAPAEGLAFRLAIYPYDEPLPEPAVGVGTHSVRAGDSLWRIAEDRLDDGDRWTEIWHLNRDRFGAAGFENPDLIQIGWVLVLPSAAEPTSPAIDAAASQVVEPSRVVQAGESVWSIAADELTAAWSRPPSTQEVGSYWRSLLELNEVDLSAGNDQRIYAGQQLRLAPVPAGPAKPAPLDPPRPWPGPPPLPERPPAAPSTTLPSPASTSTSRESSIQPPPDEPALDHSVPQGDGSSATDRVLVGLGGIVVLATGLILRLRILRRRRAVRGVRREPVVPSELERELSIIADVPLTRWAGQQLGRLAAGLDPRSIGDAAPVAMELSEEAGIEMLWSQRLPDAPAPWTAIDEGWSWRLSYDPEQEVPPDEIPAPIPALVTIGERDGRQLLINLEAFGAIGIEGSPEHVAELAASLTLELGASDDLANAYVYTVDERPSVGDQLDRVASVGEAEAMWRISSARSQVAAALGDTELPSSFALRCGPDALGLESSVVIAPAANPQLAPVLLSESPPQHGVATVMLGSVPEGPSARIILHPDGTARLDPLGLQFTPVRMPAPLVSQITDLLGQETVETVDLHDQPPPLMAEAVGHDAVVPVGPDPIGARTETGAERDDARSASEDRLLVRVLGPPRLPDKPGLGRREVELVVFLACKEKPVHPSTVMNAIWGGKQVQGKTLWNLMARTRRALGTFDNGEPVIPDADRVHNRLRISDRVVTDLALLRGLYEQALKASSVEAISLLERGLTLVKGEPFDAPGYDWAHHQEQFVSEASGLIEDAAMYLVELATTAGDTTTARNAILQGLRGLPGNEPLYRARMELEHATGNTAALHAAWTELVDYLTDLDTEPSDATRALYERHAARSPRRS